MLSSIECELRKRGTEPGNEASTAMVCLFLCRFSEVHFTKNYEKYVKYTPETLEETLETFFDGGA